ncbi:MAG: TMEM175 family protein, partial [Lactiplantibacillus plantarum]
MFRNSKSRFISFSDSVFSVILTVLVLEIRLPIGRNILSNSWINFGYSIIIYIAGFSLVSTYWFFHQKLFSNVKQI